MEILLCLSIVVRCEQEVHSVTTHVPIIEHLVQTQYKFRLCLDSASPGTLCIISELFNLYSRDLSIAGLPPDGPCYVLGARGGAAPLGANTVQVQILPGFCLPMAQGLGLGTLCIISKLFNLYSRDLSTAGLPPDSPCRVPAGGGAVKKERTSSGTFCIL